MAISEFQNPLKKIIGKTMSSVVMPDIDSIQFVATDGSRYQMVHHGICCEHVTIEDVVGDLTDLVGSPILMADEETNSDDLPSQSDPRPESYTWTYYKFATIKGYVTVRWYGSSNGYYSEQATFEEIL